MPNHVSKSVQLILKPFLFDYKKLAHFCSFWGHLTLYGFEVV